MQIERKIDNFQSELNKLIANNEVLKTEDKLENTIKIQKMRIEITENDIRRKMHGIDKEQGDEEDLKTKTQEVMRKTWKN